MQERKNFEGVKEVKESPWGLDQLMNHNLISQCIEFPVATNQRKRKLGAQKLKHLVKASSVDPGAEV